MTNKMLMSKMRQIMGPEAFDEMFSATYDVGAGHEILQLLVPPLVHERLHGEVKEDEMEEMLHMPTCIYKMIQYLVAKQGKVEEVKAILYKWNAKKKEAGFK